MLRNATLLSTLLNISVVFTYFPYTTIVIILLGFFRSFRYMAKPCRRAEGKQIQSPTFSASLHSTTPHKPNSYAATFTWHGIPTYHFLLVTGQVTPNLLVNITRYQTLHHTTWHTTWHRTTVWKPLGVGSHVSTQLLSSNQWWRGFLTSPT